MKTILIACGTGMASSAIMSAAVRDLLRRNRMRANVVCCGYSQMGEHLPEANMVIVPMKMANQTDRPVLLGTPFLTGVGVEELERDILCGLKETS